HCSFLRSLTPRPPPSTLFPYTTLFRSLHIHGDAHICGAHHLDAEAGEDLSHLPQLAGVMGRQYELHTVSSCSAARSRRLFRMVRSEEHTSELQSRFDLVCRLLLEKKKA